MLEKYQKIIEEARSKKSPVQDFLEKEIGLSDFNFDIAGDELKIECSSQDRFILKMKKFELENFLKDNKLKIKF